MPLAVTPPQQEPTTSQLSLVSTQFQVFLKQINSSLVDSNMLVRCVTLSLDRFENQVDMKGKKRPEANADPSSVASLVLDTQFPARDKRGWKKPHQMPTWMGSRW